MKLSGLSIKGVDSKALAAVAVAAVVFIAVAWGFYYAHSTVEGLQRRVAAKKSDIATFEALAAEYRERRSSVETVSKKAYARDTAGGVAALEGMAKRVGAGSLIASVKPLGEKSTLGYTERTLEVALEGITLNQLVNLLYLLENDRTLFAVQEFSMDSRFEDPDLLDVTLKIAHITRLPVS